MARRLAPESEQTGLFDGKSEMVVTKETGVSEITEDFLDGEGDGKAEQTKPVCFICGKVGTQTYAQLLDGTAGPAHGVCVRTRTAELLAERENAQVDNPNEGIAKPWESKAYRKVTDTVGDPSIGQVMVCSAGKQHGGMYEACGLIDGKMSIVIWGEKVDTVNNMFRAALESAGFKEEK